MRIDFEYLDNLIKLNAVNPANGFRDQERNALHQGLRNAARVVNENHNRFAQYTPRPGSDPLAGSLIKIAQRYFFDDMASQFLCERFGLNADHLTTPFEHFQTRFENITALLDKGLSQEQIEARAYLGGFNKAAMEFEDEVNQYSNALLALIKADALHLNSDPIGFIGHKKTQNATSIKNLTADEYDQMIVKSFMTVVRSGLSLYSQPRQCTIVEDVFKVALQFYIVAWKQLRIIEVNFGSDIYRSALIAGSEISKGIAQAEMQVMMHSMQGSFEFDVYFRFFSQYIYDQNRNSAQEGFYESLSDLTLLPADYVVEFAQSHGELAESKAQLNKYTLRAALNEPKAI